MITIVRCAWLKHRFHAWHTLWKAPTFPFSEVLSVKVKGQGLEERSLRSPTGKEEWWKWSIRRAMCYGSFAFFIFLNFLIFIWHSTAIPQIARFMGPTWDPPGADRTQVGPMLAPWTLLLGTIRPMHWLLMPWLLMLTHGFDYMT